MTEILKAYFELLLVSFAESLKIATISIIYGAFIFIAIYVSFIVSNVIFL